MQTIIESMNSSFDVCHGLVWEQSQISREGEVLFKGTATQVAERWNAIRAFISTNPEEQEVNEFFSEIFEDAVVSEIDEACAAHDFSHMSTPELNKHITKKLKNAAAHNLSQRASEHLQAAQKEYKRRTRLGESIDELKVTLKGSLIASIAEGLGAPLDEVSAAAMGRAIEHDWTSNLDDGPATHVVKHPKHAGSAVNNVPRAHPASNPSGHKFAVMHHDGTGWKVTKHERIETAAREFGKHAHNGHKVKIVDNKGNVIHSTHEDVLLDDELMSLQESEFLSDK